MANCPSPEEISVYLLGLNAESWRGTSDHIDKCGACQQTIVGLGNESDTLITSLRQPPPPVSPAEEARLSKLLDRASKLLTDGRETGDRHIDNEVQTDRTALLRQLGQYELLEKLGEGGMGTVYKARHTRLDRVVALKILRTDLVQTPEKLGRFEREIKAVGRLDHPNIVRATDAGEAAGVHFLVMEYVEGADLSNLVGRSGTLPVPEACEIVRQAAAGLQHAHGHGFVHRDVKPSNLMLTRRGEVKLLDLGLALLRTDCESELTEYGQVMGTADYIAPEQSGSSHEVDIRADIYSLGATLYRLLCGSPPFSGPGYQTAFEKMKGLAEDPVPPIRSRRPDLPDELVSVLDRMLAKKPAERFATPAEVVQALAPLAAGADLSTLLTATSEPSASLLGALPASVPLDTATRYDTTTAQPAPPETTGSTLRRRVWVWTAGIAVLAVLIVGAVQIVVRVKDRDGKVVTEVPVPTGGTVELVPAPDQPAAATNSAPERRPDEAASRPLVVAAPPAPDVESTEPLSSAALVTRPARLEGVRSWSIETVNHRSGFGYFRSQFDYGRRRIGFRPDGRLLAIASEDGTIRLLDAETGRTERMFVNRAGIVKALAWSPDGRTLAAGTDGAVSFWDPDHGHVRNEAPVESLSDLAWSPDGKRLAVAAAKLELWDDEQQQFLPHEDGSPRCDRLDWKPDGTALAVSVDQRIVLIDPATRREIRKIFEVKPGRLNDLGWSPDGRYLAHASEGPNGARLWDSQTDEFRTVGFEQPPQDFLGFTGTLDWSPDGRLNLCFSTTVSTQLTAAWDLATGEVSRSYFNGSQHPTTCLEWSPDGRTLMLGTYHGRLLAFDPEKPDESRWQRLRPAGPPRWFGSTGAVLSWSSDGRRLVLPFVLSNNDWFAGDVGLWDLQSRGFLSARLVNARNPAWSPDGTLVLAPSPHEGTVLFDARTMARLNAFEPSDVYAAAFAPHGKDFAIALGDRVEIRNVLSGSVVRRLPAEGLLEHCTVAWSSDGQFLAAGNSVDPESTMYVWNAASGERCGPPEPVPHQGAPCGFAPDGRLLARQLGGGFCVIDIHQGTAVRSTAVAGLRDAAWSADYRSVRTIDAACVILHWSLESSLADEVSRLPTADATFAPGAEVVLTGSSPTLRFWDANTGRPVATLVVLTEGRHLSISPEGHYSGSDGMEDDLVYVVETDAGQETLSSDEFSRRYGWKNDPEQVKLPLPAGQPE